MKIYNEANGNKLKWLVKIMTGNIFNFFIFKLEKWLIEDKYKKTMKDFSKAVAIMIKYNPHIECYKYAVYIASFVEWMQTFEEDIICIQTIVDGIYENLQTVFFPKDAKKYKEEGTILEKINNAPAHLSWQDCAKSCNDQFSKLDFKIEKHVNFLDMIKKRAEEAKRQKDDKINSLKRKSDVIKTEAEDNPKKKMKRSQEEEKSSAETAETAEPAEPNEGKDRQLIVYEVNMDYENEKEEEEVDNPFFKKRLEEKKRREEEAKAKAKAKAKANNP